MNSYGGPADVLRRRQIAQVRPVDRKGCEARKHRAERHQGVGEHLTPASSPCEDYPSSMRARHTTTHRVVTTATASTTTFIRNLQTAIGCHLKTCSAGRRFKLGRLPAITVVILNFNGQRWLRGCLDAVENQVDAPPYETLVVDNGSQDGSPAFVRRTYPSVQLAELPENRGFAAGNNAGAAHAAGEWLAFLNNDTVAAPDWLARLWASVRSRPEFALVTSRLVFLDDPGRVDSAGDGYYRAGGAFKHGHGQPAAQFTDSRETFGACGGAFMIRRDAFLELNGFDERFFMLYEDVDLSYRARLAGLRVWYAADAVVRHAGSGSMGVLSDATVFHGQRNLEWTWVKNTPWRLLLATAVPHALYSTAGVLYYVRAGRGKAAVRGKFAALAALPAVWRDRRRVQASACTPARHITRLMERGWMRAKRREKRFDGGRAIESA